MAEINLWDDMESVQFDYSMHLVQFTQRQKVTGGYSSETIRLPGGRVILTRNALSAYQQDCRFAAGQLLKSFR